MYFQYKGHNFSVHDNESDFHNGCVKDYNLYHLKFIGDFKWWGISSPEFENKYGDTFSLRNKINFPFEVNDCYLIQCSEKLQILNVVYNTTRKILYDIR